MTADLPRAMAPSTTSSTTWTAFHKKTVRHDSVAETTTTPIFDTADNLVMSHSTIMEAKLHISPQAHAEKDVLLQERYLSSEEELSPMEPDLSDSSSMMDDEDDIKDDFSDVEEFEIMEAVRVSTRPILRQSAFSLAVIISVLSPGKAKMVDIPRPQVLTRQFTPQTRPDRVSSLSGVALPPTRATPSRPISEQRLNPIRTTGLSPIRRATAQIVNITTSSPRSSRGSMLYTPSELYSTHPRLSIMSTSSSTSSSIKDNSKDLNRASTLPSPPRSSEIKPPARSRLRGFSKTLSLARFVNNKRDSQQQRKISSPPPVEEQELSRTSSPSSDYSVESATSTYSTASPSSPITPDTATIVLEPQQPLQKPNGRPVTATLRLVPRGADERAPPIELPPYPDSEDGDCEGSTEDFRGLAGKTVGLKNKPRRLRRMDSLEQIDVATFLASSN